MILRGIGVIFVLFGVISVFFGLYLKISGGIVDDISSNKKLKFIFFMAVTILMVVLFTFFSIVK